MTKAHEMAAPKMTRVTVRVPKATLEEINQWVDELGVRRSHFLALALVAGARSLMQACAFEPLAVTSEDALLSDDLGQDTVDDAVADLRTQVTALQVQLEALQAPVDPAPAQTET